MSAPGHREPREVRVHLTTSGKDGESLWADDLGPAPGLEDARRVRLNNIPVLRAKPTYGDVIVARADGDGRLTWDQGEVEWSDIASIIDEDGGRWPMIVDYVPRDGVSAESAFLALGDAVRARDIAFEGAHGPREGEPGRVYLAVPEEVSTGDVMEALRGVDECAVRLVHPVRSEDDEV